MENNIFPHENFPVDDKLCKFSKFKLEHSQEKFKLEHPDYD